MQSFSGKLLQFAAVVGLLLAFFIDFLVSFQLPLRKGREFKTRIHKKNYMLKLSDKVMFSTRPLFTKMPDALFVLLTIKMFKQTKFRVKLPMFKTIPLMLRMYYFGV